MVRRALTGVWATCVCLMFHASTALAAGDIVLYASDAANLHGNWALAADATAAGGQLLSSTDYGWSTTSAPLSAPVDYFDLTFTAAANTPYHVWFRLRAANNSKWNDSVWVQFNDSLDANGAVTYRTGTTSGLLVNLENCSGCGDSGWGWQDHAWWLAQSAVVQFPTTGAHTLRVQTREDGVQIDQIVISPSTYVSAAPGAVMNDHTIVAKPVVSTPFFGAPAAIPGTVQIVNFDNGGEGVAYHDLTAANEGGAYRQTGVDITTGSEGGYIVGWVGASEWLNYTVNVASAGTYTVNFRVACLGQGGTFHLEMSGANVTGAVTVPNTGGWQTWQTVSKTVTLTAGQQVARLVMDTNGTYAVGNFAWMQFVAGSTPPPPPPPGNTPTTPSSPNPASGTLGVTTTPNLSWQSSGATSYEVRLGAANPPPTVVPSQPAYYYGPPALNGGTTYYWQIVATNSSGSTAGPVWSFRTDGVPAPPPPPPTTVINVPAGGDLQAAINNANPGDTLLLQAGATFTGNFVLPMKSGTSMITIRSAAPDSSLPPANTRIDPSYSALLPKLQSPNGMPALATAAGAHHYTVLFVEFLANALGAGDIVTLGDGSAVQNSLAMVPHDLVLDRCYLHGDLTNGQKRAIALNSASTTVTNSYIAEIKAVGQDSQALAGWNGPGPFTITNNYLEAAGENVLFGGGDPAILNLIPSDITVRGNYLTKQVIWRSQPSWNVKNLFELKNAQRVVVDGNVMEYNWLSAQTGYAVLFTPRNQDGGCPWCNVQQVQFTNNLVRHIASGFNILGTDNNHPSGTLNNVTIRNNLFEDMSGATWGGDGRFMLIGAGAQTVVADHNTALQDGTSALYGYGAPMTGFAFTNNIVPDNSWAIMGASAAPGNGTIALYFPTGLFLDGIFAGSNPAIYPVNNYYPASMSAVGFVNLAGGNYRLSATSPYHNKASDGTDVGCNIDALDAAARIKY